MVSTDVGGSLLEDLRIVMEEADAPVAGAAEESSDIAGIVAMVDVEFLLSMPARWGLPADGAFPVLGTNECGEFVRGQSVAPLSMLLSESSAVVPLPLGVRLSYALLVERAIGALSLPCGDSAEVAITAPVEGDSSSAGATPGCPVGLVDLRESVYVSQPSMAFPPLSARSGVHSVLFDCCESAVSAVGRAVLHVDLAESVPFDHSSRVALEESHGLALDPAPVSTGLGGDAGVLPAPAMALPEADVALRGAATTLIHRKDCTS